MRNSGYYVLQALFTTLNDNVVVDGDTIHVCSALRANMPTDYVYIGEHTRVDWGGAEWAGSEETITIQILSRENPDYPDKTRVNQIADAVCGLIKPTVKTELTVSNFDITGLHLDNQFNDYALGDNDAYHRIILIWRYLANEILSVAIRFDTDIYKFDTDLITWDNG